MKNRKCSSHSSPPLFFCRLFSSLSLPPSPALPPSFPLPSPFLPPLPHPNTHTVFARSNAAATIYSIAQFCAAFIRERRLLNSGFSLKSFVIVRALRKASFRHKINEELRCGGLVLKQTFFSLISRRFATKRYLHDTSDPFHCFLPTISHDDRPLRLKNAELLWTVCVLVPIVYSFDIAIRARGLFTCAYAT